MDHKSIYALGERDSSLTRYLSLNQFFVNCLGITTVFPAIKYRMYNAALAFSMLRFCYNIQEIFFVLLFPPSSLTRIKSVNLIMQYMFEDTMERGKQYQFKLGNMQNSHVATIMWPLCNGLHIQQFIISHPRKSSFVIIQFSNLL